MRIFRQVRSDSHGHELRGFPLRDHGNSGEGVGVHSVPLSVIVMPMRVEQVANRLARPLADLGDVLACARWQITRVDYEHSRIADDDNRISLREMIRGVGMTNFVDAIG